MSDLLDDCEGEICCDRTGVMRIGFQASRRLAQTRTEPPGESSAARRETSLTSAAKRCSTLKKTTEVPTRSTTERSTAISPSVESQNEQEPAMVLVRTGSS